MGAPRNEISRVRKAGSSGWSSNRICRRAGLWRSLASRAPPSTGGATSIRAAGRKRWKIDLPGRIASGTASDEPELSPRELATRFTDTKSYFVSEASVYRLLKDHDLIASTAYIVIKAADEFKDKTTAPNQLWQTDFTYLKVIGWGWFYLSTI